jgi:hypothetical protein
VRPERDADPSPPSSTEIKNRVDIYLLLSLRAFVAYEKVKPTYHPSVKYSVAKYSSSNSTYTLTTDFLFVTVCVITCLQTKYEVKSNIMRFQLCLNHVSNISNVRPIYLHEWLIKNIVLTLFNVYGWDGNKQLSLCNKKLA